jgi:hypothetical protein
MRKRLKNMTALFLDFAWEFSQYLPVYDLMLIQGCALQYLAESADPRESQGLWNRSFESFGNARSLLNDAEWRGK